MEAVGGDGAASHASRLAVAHVLYLDDDDERDRWRSNLDAGVGDPTVIKALGFLQGVFKQAVVRDAEVLDDGGADIAQRHSADALA